MKDIPALLLAIEAVVRALGLYVVVPLALFSLLKWPPAWASRLFVKRAKFLGTEIEIERQPEFEVTPAPGTAVIPPPPSDGDREKVEAPAALAEESREGSRFSTGLDLLKSGQYERGMELIRADAAGEADADFGISLVGLGYYVAYRSGTTRALADLKAWAASHRNNGMLHAWLARAYDLTANTDEAIDALQVALEVTHSESERAEHTVERATYLTKLGRFEEALSGLTSELARLNDPGTKSTIFRGAAAVFEAKDGAGSDSSMLMYEQAIRYAPFDASLRFDVAYKYGDHDTFVWALFHYRQLLAIAADHEAGLNNAGVAAERLKLRITAVGYYRKAEEQDSSLAMSNLASTLLRVGFASEATSLIEKARSVPEPNRRVESTAGEIASAQQKEEAKLEELNGGLEKLRRWRLEEAAAILHPTPSVQDLVGDYLGPPGLRLDTDPNGYLVGTFNPGGFYGALRLTGKLNGRALKFGWRTEGSGLLTSKAGFGVLIASDGALKGFYAEGIVGEDLTADTIKEWSLVKKSVPLLSSGG